MKGRQLLARSIRPGDEIVRFDGNQIVRQVVRDGAEFIIETGKGSIFANGSETFTVLRGKR